MPAMKTQKRILLALTGLSAAILLAGCGGEDSANSQDFSSAAAERGYQCAETMPMATGVETEISCIHTELGELTLSTFESPEARDSNAGELELEHAVPVADTSAVAGEDQATVEEIADTLQ